jgi:hypothetical protein
MTASAQLPTLPAACREEIVPRDARSVRPVARIRLRPVPPAPVPPLGPLGHGRQLACPVHRRFGRVVSLVAAATVMLIVVGGLGWTGRGTNPGIPARNAVVRVGAGETEWDVARRVAPRYDQRAVVERIRQLNGIVGSAVQPGQPLLVPDGR